MATYTLTIVNDEITEPVEITDWAVFADHLYLDGFRWNGFSMTRDLVIDGEVIGKEEYYWG